MHYFPYVKLRECLMLFHQLTMLLHIAEVLVESAEETADSYVCMAVITLASRVPIAVATQAPVVVDTTFEDPECTTGVTELSAAIDVSLAIDEVVIANVGIKETPNIAVASMREDTNCFFIVF